MKDLQTISIEGREQLEAEVNEMISKGWKVESIQTNDIYKIRLSKESGNHVCASKIPLLPLLHSTMLFRICKELGLEGFYGDAKPLLISKIEEFGKPKVIDIYNELSKNYETN